MKTQRLSLLKCSYYTHQETSQSSFTSPPIEPQDDGTSTYVPIRKVDTVDSLPSENIGTIQPSASLAVHFVYNCLIRSTAFPPTTRPASGLGFLPHLSLHHAAMTQPFSVTKARAQFPALQQSHQVYFDNAGGSQVLSTVASSYACTLQPARPR